MPKIKKIAVAGLGISGCEAALLAHQKGYETIVLDTAQSTALQNRASYLTEKGLQVFTGIDPDTFTLPFTADSVVISPGIDPRGSFGKYIYSLGCPVISELEFAAGFTKIPLIGITGTNGKTTTVEIVTHCLNKLGKKSISAGNIGLALSRVVRENENFDFIVVEVSSFQLEAVSKLEFMAGALLNISSDHIDRYNSFQEYGDTKIKLLQHSKNIVISKKLLSPQWSIPGEKCTSVTGCENDKSLDLFFKDGKIVSKECIFDYSTHPLQGIHNAENLMAAMALIRNCGFTMEETWPASLSYQPAAHRMQYILEHKGVRIYNDSKATNPDALLMALNSLGDANRRNIVLIAGGRDKKMDFKIVNTALCSYTREVYLYGECCLRLYEVWKHKVPCIVCKNFAEAVQRALGSVTEGETLLLSPGCSSLDSFRNYEERGNEFVKTVQEWTANER